MFSYSCTLLLCISEPRPCPRGKIRICFRGCNIKRKRKHKGTSDVQTYNFAILKKKKELNTSISHYNLPRSRTGELQGTIEFIMRKIMQMRRRGEGSSTSRIWELWERKQPNWVFRPGLLPGGVVVRDKWREAAQTRFSCLATHWDCGGDPSRDAPAIPGSDSSEQTQ